MSKWRKAGVVRLSRSKKVVLLGIEGLNPKKWLIVDVEKLFELIEGKVFEIDVFEGVE